MRGVILDADSLGEGIDLSPVTSLLDDWQVYPFTRPEETAHRIRDAAVVLTNKTLLDRPVLQSTEALRFVSIMATGTNNVDLHTAQQKNIAVSNAIAYGTPSVVQHTLSLILTLSGNLHRYLADVRQGSWQKSHVFTLLDHPIVEINGKTIGIVGYGELGRGVASAASALGMKVLISEHPGRDQQIRDDRLAFEEVLEASDYLSLHCPLTPETLHIINAANLGRMKPTAFLINTARGGLIEASALIDALHHGTIAGAAIDVLDEEPPGIDQPLISAAQDLSNLLITPHNAWGAVESRNRLVQQMRENVLGFVNNAPVRLVTA